jgi:hypothetical protein
MEIVKRPHSRPDPFEPSEDFVTTDMDRLYDAIYNVRLHHHYGRKDPAKSFNAACDLAISILKGMKVQA